MPAVPFKENFSDYMLGFSLLLKRIHFTEATKLWFIHEALACCAIEYQKKRNLFKTDHFNVAALLIMAPVVLKVFKFCQVRVL